MGEVAQAVRQAVLGSRSYMALLVGAILVLTSSRIFHFIRPRVEAIVIPIYSMQIQECRVSLKLLLY